ncbi:MAG: hypothetical protein ACOX69_08550 [Coriobacteriales bacterium]
MGGHLDGGRIEPSHVVDHQAPLDARCAEPSHVVDHQTRFGHVPESGKL